MKETVLAAALALSLGSPSAFAAETADVVVVGAGAAGLSSSIGAAARGAKPLAPNSASGSPPWGAKSGRASWRPATEPRSVPASSRF